MQTTLGEFIKGTPEGDEALAILRRCVHCGFCNATCPTYQLLGDELDGPRGRIYLVRQALEGVTPTAQTQLHLDRCLTCRACETTCPSGVQYGRLLDIGRQVVSARVQRPVGERIARAALRTGLTGPLFAPALKVGQVLKPLLPQALGDKVPARRVSGEWPRRRNGRFMLLLAGCVQPSLMPNVNAATARVLDALGIDLVAPAAAGCCGAIRQHLDDPAGALDDVRRNIDAWWPQVEAGAEAIVMNASGCGAMVRDYGHLLRNDPRYAAKAAQVTELTRDVAEVLADRIGDLAAVIACDRPERVAFHSPCTLQHGQKIRGTVESLLSRLGAELVPVADSHLCCGSAGAYSILQPALSQQLRDRKLAALGAARPDVILSANVGCIEHLAAKSEAPVRHWIEWVAERLAS